ncbi:hypothetical protein MSPP1_000523 [Malassezia sp. CBS 17886]|nr:hypothetical protein MSPP1_000523 [Malassezia sp. CBS 17886]
MEKLAPSPPAGAPRSWLSHVFPGRDVDIARRAKYLSAQERHEHMGGVEQPADVAAGAEDAAPEHTDMSKVDRAVYEDVNGQYVEEVLPLPPTLGAVGAFWNMIAYSIALGILSIPLVVATIGIVPFILLTLLFAALTYYTGYSYWRLAMMYPGVHSLQQAGDLLFGPIGATAFSIIQTVFSIFLQGNHALLGGYAFWYLGWRDCMVGMVAVFSAVSFLFTLPRSYKVFSVQAAISFTSIFTVVIIAMIASGVSGPTNKSPDDPPRRVLAFGATPQVPHNFLDGFLGVTNIFVSFGATPAYLPVIAEMKEPRHFKRSLATLVAVSTVMYAIVGCIMNYNLGQYTKSPSLGSLSTVMIKVSYGLALPTILVAGCASGQVSGKVLFLNFFSGRRRHLAKNRALSWGVWIVINVITWCLAFVLAEVIPFFSSFLGLESALFWSFFLALSAVFYFWRHQHDAWSSKRNRIGFLIALAVFSIALVLMVAGTWAAAISIRDEYRAGNVGSPFSCAMAA